jgi:hypothetical protein
MADNEKSTSSPGQHTAGAFDVRVIIGGLIGTYGIVLVIMGLVNQTDEDLAKADGLNINLWAGLGMIVFGAAFILWARIRPIVVPEHIAAGVHDPDAGKPGH